MRIHLIDCQKKQQYHYSNLLASAFINLGHEVFAFDSAEYPRLYLKIDRFIKRSPLYLLAKFNSVTYDFKEKQRAFISAEWLKTIKEFNPDLVIMINNSFINVDAIRAAKENLQIKKIACWVVDDPSRTQAEDLVSLLPYCDIVFCTDPGCIPLITFFNKNAVYLPLASSDACYKPLDVEKKFDVSFVGSFFRNDPAGYFRAFVLSQLPAEHKVIISGPGIAYFKEIYPRLKKFDCRDQYIGIEAVNELYNSSKATISLYNPQVISGISPRVFEVALSKTFQVIQDTPTIHELFPGIVLPLFSSTAEFLAKVEHYLMREKERKEIIETMYEMTKQKHRFENRVQSILAHI